MNDGREDIRRAAAELAERLPDPLAPLARLAYNYRWSWLPGGPEVFSAIDPDPTHAADLCVANPGTLFGTQRHVTGRNAPTVVGAVFFRDAFWDGRANHMFNGVDPFGQTGNAGGYGVAGRNVATTHSNNGAGLLADGGAANDGLHAFAGGANRVGVYAYSDLGTSLNLNQGPNDTAPALFMHATGPTHDLIQITDQGGSDILALDASPLMLLHGQIQATSTSGTTAIFSNYPGNHFPAMLLYAGTSGTGQPVFNVSDDLLNQELSVTDQGDLYIHGLMFSGGSCHSGCLTGNDQTRSVREYSPVESEPTIEDNGEAALVDGRADVALDPKFANVIDTTKPYLVTITPEGDSNGLYVASRSAAGFSVRESKGGRSNIGFVYRIVARRYGVDAPRLPMTVIRHASPPARDIHHHN